MHLQVEYFFQIKLNRQRFNFLGNLWQLILHEYITKQTRYTV